MTLLSIKTTVGLLQFADTWKNCFWTEADILKIYLKMWISGYHFCVAIITNFSILTNLCPHSELYAPFTFTFILEAKSSIHFYCAVCISQSSNSSFYSA